MASNAIGCITKFKPENEKIEVNLEHVQLFFEVNGIKEDKHAGSNFTKRDCQNYLKSVE